MPVLQFAVAKVVVSVVESNVQLEIVGFHLMMTVLQFAVAKVVDDCVRIPQYFFSSSLLPAFFFGLQPVVSSFPVHSVAFPLPFAFETAAQEFLSI